MRMNKGRSTYDLYHIFRGRNRVAKVYNTESGFEVELYENDKLIETRELYKHSEGYAEDCAENWVNGLIE